MGAGTPGRCKDGGSTLGGRGRKRQEGREEKGRREGGSRLRETVVGGKKGLGGGKELE